MKLEKIAVDYGTLDMPDDPGQNKLYRVIPFTEYQENTIGSYGGIKVLLKKTEWVISYASWDEKEKQEFTQLYAADKEGSLLPNAIMYDNKVIGTWDCDLPLRKRGYRIVRKLDEEQVKELLQQSGIRTIYMR